MENPTRVKSVQMGSYVSSVLTSAHAIQAQLTNRRTKFSATRNVDELLSLCVYCHDRINPHLFIYALSVVMVHRPDTRNLTLPSHAEIFPKLYMDSSVFSRIREESAVVESGSRVSIELISYRTYGRRTVKPSKVLSTAAHAFPRCLRFGKACCSDVCF